VPSRSNLLTNAFHPGKELDDPGLFAGRSHQVIQLAQALHTEGSCPIIYGDRGLGKSSLALQAQRIAMGDVELLQDQGAPQWTFGEEDSYLAFYVPCSDAIQNTEAILQRLINSLSNVQLDNPSAPSARELIDRTTRKRVSFKIFEAETLRRYQPRQSEPSYARLTVEEQLLGMVTRLNETLGHNILLIVDELDRVRDTNGLASFIKIASSEQLKFLLVGIGQNISHLLSDHQSLERIAVPVEVPRMTRDELNQIVHRSMTRLQEQGLTGVWGLG
jgi:Cdc6-like AAA superfamily ATPase